ncbi:MAG: UvrB/UvrC motif-containing protein [Clostridia bacterium]
MKCDKCGRPSVYRSTLIVNGVSQTTNLCRDCAIQEGVFTTQSSIFDDMFSAFSDFLPFEKVENISCPVCKLTMREFKNSGKLGCPNCYEAFREEISKIIKRIAPHEKHKQDTILKPKKSENKQDKITALRDEMRKAVAEERYEDAAKIKKQIQKLENKDE